MMPARITTATPERIPELSSFLRDVFQFPPDAPSFRPDLMHWKYFEPHPWWPDGRSYILENQGVIAAHGCITPVRFLSKGRSVESAQVIDWAASGAAPGGGVVIYRYCLSLLGTLLAIGGSEITQRLIPTVRWFRKRCDMNLYARPLHALRYFAVSPHRSARTVLKVTRNFAWSLSPRLPDTSQWRCTPVPDFERVSTPSDSFIAIQRTAEWLNYFLRCPASHFQALVLSDGGQWHGYALLSFVGPQARIVDFAIDSADAKEWLGALSAVIRWVALQPGVGEIAGGSSLDFFQRLYTAAGMRLRTSWPVYLADPKGCISQDAELEINFLIGDASFLCVRNDSLWC